MTDSIREQVLSAFKTQISSITGITGLVIERNRDAPTTTFPMLIVLDGGLESDNSESNLAKYTMQVFVEGWVKSTTANIGRDTNQLYAKAVQAALNDRTLGNLAVDVTELETDFNIDRSEGKPAIGFFNTIYEIIFFTRQGDPFTLAP